ncbi:hypothetical protein [Thermoflavimicrobium dichotomicum]|uniref:EamA-like transporter family protein n=1 Tax=Thermoflavimicrobium dichotomicum TaxID=46223 RepID=A0A1I3R6P2_9BACL|nr:hypothetical protein [Thermoflavimicrobium dichotomicum]SFJ41319.1 hypothetical protein SAMN05421852_10921 [Thermoflavimicrobium dichotomicum]
MKQRRLLSILTLTSISFIWGATFVLFYLNPGKKCGAQMYY